MAMISSPVGAADVAAAHDVLRDVLPPTPLLHSRVLSERLGGPVFLKCENLQRTGSFKARGGYLRISRLSEAERANGVVAASAGNHAQGVAFAAEILGVKATVVMPHGAPLPKIEATRGYGADIIFHGETVDDAVEYAREYAAERSAVLIHPFDHPDIVAGQGTLGLEILQQCPQVRTIAIPVGGGGVCAGVTVAVKSADPTIQVIGVQAEAVAGYPASLAAGHPVRVAAAPTMADGIAVCLPGDIPFGIISAYEDRVVTVSEESLSRALVLCLERAKQVVEQAGAAGVAGLLEYRRHVRAAGGRGAVRRQHRPAAAVQGAPARAGRGRPVPDVPVPDPGPAGRAGRAAGRGGRPRRQRAGRDARADHAAAPGGRGGGAAPGGDAWPGALRRGDQRTALGRVPADVPLSPVHPEPCAS